MIHFTNEQGKTVMEMTSSNVVKNLLKKYQALGENTESEQVTYEFDEFGG